MTTRSTTFSLRLPLSLRAAIEQLATADGTSMNQFLVMAAAEKVSSIQTAEEFFAERKRRSDKAAALAFIRDGDGEEPQSGDELPIDPLQKR